MPALEAGIRRFRLQEAGIPVRRSEPDKVMSARARSLAVLVVAVLLGGFVAMRAAAAPAQPVPTSSSSTETTEPPTTTPVLPFGPGSSTTTTTAPPEGGSGSPPATLPPSGSSAPPQSGPDQGDGGSAPASGGSVPDWAQKILSSLVRTPPNDDRALVDGANALEAAGMAHDEAVRLAYGRFPVAGPARWSDDWLTPRWNPHFRFHLGCDIAAAYGTPVRAPVDGVVRIGDEPLGGRTVTVVQADGLSFYMAHLSGLAGGIATGVPVKTGDIVGFVGQSGDATAPHVHFGIRNAAGAPAPPKPVIDQWVADAAARIPDLLAQFHPAPVAAPEPSLAATAEVRSVANAAAMGDVAPPSTPSQTELVWAAAANPAGGPLQLVEAQAADAVDRIDWKARAQDQQTRELRRRNLAMAARAVTGPLTPPALWFLLQ